MSVRALTWRLARRGAVAWALAVVLILLTGAVAYRAAYPDVASRRAFALTIGSSRGLDALYGRSSRLDTVGGFIAWRYGTTIAVVVALWLAMATTRILRGDEESGRADLLLSGSTGPRRVLAEQALGIGAAALLVTLAAFVGCLAAGLSVTGSALFAATVAAGGALFASIAALVSQFTRTRRRSLGITGAILGAAYLVRALGDGAPHRQWLTWATPLGWVERIAPFEPHHSVLAAVLVVAAVLVACAVTVVARDRRDTGDSALPARADVARTRRITSIGSLDVILRRGALAGWSVGMALTGLLFGFIAADIAKFMADNPTVSKRTSNITGSSLASVKGFLGLSFAVIAVIAALYAGAQMVTTRRDEETTLANLVTAGATRMRWLAVRLLDAAVSLVVITLVAGLAGWAGVRLSGQPLAVADAVRGAANTIPTGVLFLGLATAGFGLRPRAVTAVAYGSVALSYALLIVTTIGGTPRWVIDLSPFSHLAAVPAAPANTLASVVLVLAGALGIATGFVAFDRRDLLAE